MALSNPPHTGKHHPTTITKLFIKLLTIKHFNKITAEQQTMANYMDFGWSSANVRDTPTFTFSANSTFGGVHNALYTHTHTQKYRGKEQQQQTTHRWRFLFATLTEDCIFYLLRLVAALPLVCLSNSWTNSEEVRCSRLKIWNSLFIYMSKHSNWEYEMRLNDF